MSDKYRYELVAKSNNLEMLRLTFDVLSKMGCGNTIIKDLRERGEEKGEILADLDGLRRHLWGELDGMKFEVEEEGHDPEDVPNFLNFSHWYESLETAIEVLRCIENYKFKLEVNNSE